MPAKRYIVFPQGGGVKALPPQWFATPNILFVQGTASSVNLNSYCADPQNLPLTFSIKNGSLPAGCSFISPLLSYNGSGPVASDAIQFTASNKFRSADSLPSTVQIVAAGQAGTLPGFSLTPTVSNPTGAWTFGQGFIQGAVPAGLYVTIASGASQYQVEPRNLWPDNSLKFAVVSAISPMVANASLPITFSTTSTAPTGTVVPEPTIAPGTVVVGLSPATGTSFPISGSGSFDLASVIGASTTWSPSAITKTLSILGTTMSEFHYSYPTGFGQLLVLFRLRVYANGLIEVQTGMHNGFWQAAAPGEQDYNITLSINGQIVFSQVNVIHISHTRAWRVDWIQATNGPSIPLHAFAYLRQAKLLGNYGYLSPQAATLTQWKQKTSNLSSWFSQINGYYGDITTAINAGGADPHIGPIPRWEALLCTTGNAGMYQTVIGNTYQWGAFGQHFMDETTGLVPNWQNYPNKSVYRGPNPLPPTAAGAVPPGSDGPGFGASHAPAIGSLAYMLEGRLSHLEEAQYTAWYPLQDWSQTWTHNQGIMQPMAGQTRAFAWEFNMMGRAAAWSPTSLGGGLPPANHIALRGSFINSIQNTLTFLKGVYIDGTTPVTGTNLAANAIGWIGGYSADDPIGPYNTNGQLNVTLQQGNATVNLVSGTFSCNQGYPIFNDLGTQGVPVGATQTASLTGASSFVMSAPATASGTATVMSPYNPKVWQEGAWQYGFICQAVGLVTELAPEGVNLLDLMTLRNFVWQDNLLRWQGPTTDFNITYDYRRAIVYDFPYLINGSDPAAPQYLMTNQATYSNAYNQLKATYALNDVNLTATGYKIHPQPGPDSDIPANAASENGFAGQGYGAIHASVIAMAREAVLPKTQAKWGLVQGASNFNPQVQGASDSPELSFVPRAFTPPAWYSSIAKGTWGSPPNSVLTGSPAQLFGALPGLWNNNDGNPVNAWGGAVLVTVGITDHTGQQYPGVHLTLKGGGHVDYAGNEMYCYGPWRDANPQWRCPLAATNPPVYGSVLQQASPPGTGVDANGNHSACHTYNGPVYLPLHNELFMPGFLFTMSLQCTGSITGTVLNVSAVGGLNQTLLGPGIAPVSAAIAAGTVIQSNGTGNGGPGSYNVNISQNVASGPFVAEFLGNTSPDPSWSTTLTFPFNSQSPKWTTKQPINVNGVNYAADVACYDPLNHCVWMINPYSLSGGARSGKMVKYDLVTNTVTASTNQPWSTWGFDNCVCAFDDFYGILAVWRGSTAATSPPGFEVLLWQPSLGLNAAPWNPATDTNPWTGTPPTQGLGFGSIDYDRRLKQFVIWNNEGATLHTLTGPASGSPYQGGSPWVWNTITPVGGLTPTAENGTGTYRRFAIIDDPDMPGYMLMNRVGDPLFIYVPAN